MTFQPAIPMSGLAGWSFLQRTKEQQQQSFAQSASVRRDTDYFKEKFADIKTAEDLVDDRRLLRIALGAFGLQDDIDYRAFIRRIIEGGVDDSASLANRLSDSRYRSLAKEFSFLSATDNETTPAPDFAGKIVQKYIKREFEVSVGAQDQSMRLALTLQRELPGLSQSFSSERAQWFSLLGNPPLRKAMETVFNLPKEFGMLPIDNQYTRLRDAAMRQFGTSDLNELAQPDKLKEITQRFLLMSELREVQTGFSPAAAALFLLQR